MSGLLDGRYARSLAVAPTVWLLHFVAAYALASSACAAAAQWGASPQLTGAVGITLLSLPALVVCGYGAASSFAVWRATSADPSASFLAQTNAWLHALALIGVFWVALPSFLLSPCLH